MTERRKKAHSLDEKVEPSAASKRSSALNFAQIIGAKIKEQRVSQGMTQSSLGDLVNVSYQQMQKYESGRNVISAVLLYRVASALKTPISYFFQGIENNHTSKKGHNKASYITEKLKASEVSEILTVFSSINSSKLRRSLINTLNCISDVEK